jgi:hypothetical protein
MRDDGGVGLDDGTIKRYHLRPQESSFQRYSLCWRKIIDHKNSRLAQSHDIVFSTHDPRNGRL